MRWAAWGKLSAERRIEWGSEHRNGKAAAESSEPHLDTKASFRRIHAPNNHFPLYNQMLLFC